MKAAVNSALIIISKFPESMLDEEGKRMHPAFDLAASTLCTGEGLAFDAKSMTPNDPTGGQPCRVFSFDRLPEFMKIA